MVSLPAAAVIEDACAAPSVAHPHETGRDLANRGVPIDLLKRAVGPTPEWRGQPITPVLVVIEALRLFAGVAARSDVGAIAAHAGDMPAIQLHFDPAVDRTEDAYGWL